MFIDEQELVRVSRLNVDGDVIVHDEHETGRDSFERAKIDFIVEGVSVGDAAPVSERESKRRDEVELSSHFASH
jgi:hypothetical protein